MRIGRRLSGISLFLALLSSPAAAQEEGVFVDPDSPAGKEYAVPIDQARRQAAGDSTADGARGSTGAPLFGAGISSAGESETGGGGEGGSGDSSGSENGDSARPGSSRPRTPKPGTSDRSALVGSAGEGPSAAVQTAGLAGAVLLLGGLLALLLRRLNRGQAD